MLATVDCLRQMTFKKSSVSLADEDLLSLFNLFFKSSELIGKCCFEIFHIHNVML